MIVILYVFSSFETVLIRYSCNGEQNALAGHEPLLAAVCTLRPPQGWRRRVPNFLVFEVLLLQSTNETQKTQHGVLKC